MAADDKPRRSRGGAASAASIVRADREREAVVLRRAGSSYEEIAKRVGFADRSGAKKAVERGLSRWMRGADEELRAMELERTEAIIRRLWPSIDRDDPDRDDIALYLKVADYRARIAGLYAPRRQHVEVAVHGQVEHRKLEALRVLDADAEMAMVIDDHVTLMLEGGGEHDEDAA